MKRCGLDALFFGHLVIWMVYFAVVQNAIIQRSQERKVTTLSLSPNVMANQRTAPATTRYNSRDVPTIAAKDLPNLAAAVQTWINVIEYVDYHFSRLPRYYSEVTGINYDAWLRLLRKGTATRETCAKLAEFCQGEKAKSEQLRRGRLPPDSHTPDLSDLSIVLELAGYDTYASLARLAEATMGATSNDVRLLRDIAEGVLWKNSQLPQKQEADRILAGRRPSVDKIPLVTRQILLWLSDSQSEMPAPQRRKILGELVS